MSDLVLCDVDDGVATITLNRPERLNAINRDMGRQFDETMARVGSDPSIRVVILTGAGRGFCAGGDVGRLDDLTEDHGASLDNPPPGEFAPVFAPLAAAPVAHLSRYIITSALPQPVIAAVNGPCAGVGFSLAVNCDLRFASTQGFFAAGFPRRGLTCEAGLAFTLPAIIGQGHTADIFFSGRRVAAEEAWHMGLVNKVLEPAELMPHVQAYARDIARNVSPRSTRVTKRQLWLAREQTYLEALKSSHAEAIASFSSRDFKEGVAAFKEKRPPAFTGE